MSATVDSGRGGAARTGAERQPVRASYLLGCRWAVRNARRLCRTARMAAHSDNLPPPAFSNSLCVDEKLRFLRHNPIDQPNLLVIGSSVAWRHVDGDVLRSSAPELRPFNGALLLHANQSAYVADWLLDRQPSIRQVVMIVDPLDFAGCWKVPDAVFDREDADHYVYQQASRWGAITRYFSPRSLLRNARTIKAQRANEIEWDPLVFTRHGDGPLEARADRGLFYGEPDRWTIAASQRLTAVRTAGAAAAAGGVHAAASAVEGQVRCRRPLPRPFRYQTERGHCRTRWRKVLECRSRVG